MRDSINVWIYYSSLKSIGSINLWTYLLLHIWLINGLLIVGLVQWVNLRLLVNSVLKRLVWDTLTLILLMHLCVLLGYLMGKVLLIIGIFQLLLLLRIKWGHMLLILYHMRVCLILRSIERWLIDVLLITLVHFSAIKFIILNYNFSTAMSLNSKL